MSDVKMTLLDKAKSAERKTQAVLEALEEIVGPVDLVDLSLGEKFPLNELSYRLDFINIRCDAILERAHTLKSYFVCECENLACCAAEQEAIPVCV